MVTIHRSGFLAPNRAPTPTSTLPDIPLIKLKSLGNFRLGLEPSPSETAIQVKTKGDLPTQHAVRSPMKKYVKVSGESTCRFDAAKENMVRAWVLRLREYRLPLGSARTCVPKEVLLEVWEKMCDADLPRNFAAISTLDLVTGVDGDRLFDEEGHLCSDRFQRRWSIEYNINQDEATFQN